MTDKLLPFSVAQNPGPVVVSRQGTEVQALADQIVSVFLQILPSNYISQTKGPFYTLQFQALAEQLAKFQIESQEVMHDNFLDFTRAETLYQIAGVVAFPGSEYPRIEGDLTFRDFLKGLLPLLLKGSRADAIQQALELLTDSEVQIIPTTPHHFEVNVSTSNGEAEIDGETAPLYRFPSDPSNLGSNAQVVLNALKPAHTLYEYRHLFRDVFRVMSEDMEIDTHLFQYEDLRHWCWGAKQIQGTSGLVWTDRTLFSDTTRDFSTVLPGQTLAIAGAEYRVVEVLTLPFLGDTSEFRYSTSAGHVGYAVFDGNSLTDASQDFSNLTEGATLSVETGPNVGVYRIHALLGENGGVLGVDTPSGPVTGLLLSPSLLRVHRRIPSGSGLSYTISLQRLGRQEPIAVEDEDASSYFVGSSGTNDTLYTQFGPLVKNWGSPTPATVQDVEVKVNGLPVSVDAVNPYEGTITLTTPLTLTDPPDTVEVSYWWMREPLFQFAGLDTPGLLLDQYGTSGVPSLGGRFAFASVLGPLELPQPTRIAHRYIGLERDQSSLLDSPSTLLLDNDNHAWKQPTLNRGVAGSVQVWEAVEAPASPWLLEGTDSGTLESDGTYTLVDAVTGSLVQSPYAFYRTEVDPEATHGYLVGRLYVRSWELDGVFTGVGFAIHNNARLFFVGLLEVNGLKHVGVLVNSNRPNLQDSWDLGPRVDATLLTSTTCEVETSSLPLGLTQGSRFQILDAMQTGVYTIDSISHNYRTGKSILTCQESFPDPIDVWGNKYKVLYFEHDWTEPFTFRLEVDTDARTSTVSVSGAVRGSWEFSATSTRIPHPSETTLILPPKGSGQVAFGSFSRFAKSESTWSFFRFGFVPTTPIREFDEVLIEVDNATLPSEGTEWFRDGIGHSEVVSNEIVVTDPMRSEVHPFSESFSRLEPVFWLEHHVDLRATLRANWVSGVGPGIRISDGVKEIWLALLSYGSSYQALIPPGTVVVRQLLSYPTRSLSGYLDLEGQGWTLTGDQAYSINADRVQLAQERQFPTTTSAREELELTAALPLTTLLNNYSGDRLFECRMAITDYLSTANRVHVGFGGSFGVTGNIRQFDLTFGDSPPSVDLYCGNALVQSFPFDWTDGEPHTYRVVATYSGAVTLTIDGSLQAPSLSDLSFASTGTDDEIRWFAKSTSVASVDLYHVFGVGFPNDAKNAKRTLGVYKGGDPLDLNNWEVPRTDALSVPNTWAGAAINQVDWTGDVDIRVVRDPAWGVTVFLPGLGVPPYYVPEGPTPESGFLTSTLEPSAGWINVEYADLPQTDLSPRVSFGSLEEDSHSETFWKDVKYRIFNHPSEDRALTRQMGWDKYNIVHSGEWVQDASPEIIEVESLDSRRVWLGSSGIGAKTVFKLIENGNVYSSDTFTFDVESQTVTLLPDLSTEIDREFSSQHAIVRVVFAASVPVSEEYLAAQPIYQSPVLLNEGTPPIHWTWEGVGDLSSDTTSNPVSRDFLRFGVPSGTYFDTLSKSTLSEGVSVPLTTVCESGMGWEIDGWAFSEIVSIFPLAVGTSGPPFTLSGGGLLGSYLNGSDPLNGAIPGQFGVEVEMVDSLGVETRWVFGG